MLVAIGCVCLLFVGIQLVQAASTQRSARQALDRELAARSTPSEAPDADSSAVAEDGVVGRLDIPRLDLSAMVIEGDDDQTLALGVGHVPGSAFPWQAGNTVMAGHRDTFFRPLKDLRTGDDIRMTTAHGTFEYKVTGTEIVTPDDVAVMAPTPQRSLTLITCYPFVYVGHAPQRFVIHAR